MKSIKQEPVAQVNKDPDTGKLYVQWTMPWSLFDNGTKFYTTPPQNDPLSDEELEKMWRDGPYDHGTLYDFKLAARVTEAAHGIKDKKTWVGLTNEEINYLIQSTPYEDDHLLVEKTEALLKEKNT